MKKHGKKMIAPIVITILFILYYGGFAVCLLWMEEIPVWGKVLLAVVPLALAGVMIGVLGSRIKEIRSGDEDDLSKY